MSLPPRSSVIASSLSTGQLVRNSPSHPFEDAINTENPGTTYNPDLQPLNKSPSAPDFSQSRYFIEESKPDIPHCKDDIRVVQTRKTSEDRTVSSSEASRFNNVAAYDSTVLPAHSLPPELYMDIFLYCRENRLTLCQICRRWRQIALSTPRIWTDIRLCVTSNDMRGIQNQLDTYVERAGALSLSISFRALWKLSRGRIAEECNLISPIIPYIHRARHLHIQLPGYYFRVICDLPESSFQLLETFSFDNHGIIDSSRDYETMISRPLVTFGAAPSLTKLTLTMPVAPLQFQTFRQYPNLSICSCILRGPSPSRASGPITLKRVHTLSIRICGSDTVLPPLVIPALDHLEIISSAEISTAVLASMLSSIKGSSCRPTKLSLRLELDLREADGMDSTLIVNLMEAVPSCVEFRLYDVMYLNDEIIHKLTYSPMIRPTLLPHLETLRLEVIDMDFTETELVKMVQSRWWASNEQPTRNNLAREVARLKSVSVGHLVSELVHMDRNLDDWCQQEVARFRAEGLYIHLRASYEGV